MPFRVPGTPPSRAASDANCRRRRVARHAFVPRLRRRIGLATIVPFGMHRDLTVWNAKEKKSPASQQGAGRRPVPERCVPFRVTRMKPFCKWRRSDGVAKPDRTLKRHRRQKPPVFDPTRMFRWVNKASVRRAISRRVSGQQDATSTGELPVRKQNFNRRLITIQPAPW